MTTLHPDVAALLANVELRPIAEVGVDAARAAHAAGAAARPPGPAMAQVDDLAVAGVPVRRYGPNDATGAGVVFIHGGGWVLGGIDTHDRQCRLLAAGTGATVISVDYRLAPEHRFPAAFDDALAVTEAVLVTAEEHGIDPGRVAVAGDSAGGNLAAAAALSLRGRPGHPIAAQLLVYPVLDATMSSRSYGNDHNGLFLTGAEMASFFELYAPEADAGDWRLSPLLADDLSELPPTLVVTAEHDPLRDEGERFAGRLAETGVPATAVRYPGVTHGFFSWSHNVEPSRVLIDQACSWLRARLAAPSPSSP